MAPNPQSPVRGALIAVLAVLATCAAPDRAVAGCEDHVVVLSAGANADGAPPQPQAPSAPTAPCHGPNCSGAPDRNTPPAPVSTTPPQAKEVAAALGHCDPVGEWSARHPRD